MEGVTSNFVSITTLDSSNSRSPRILVDVIGEDFLMKKEFPPESGRGRGEERDNDDPFFASPHRL